MREFTDQALREYAEFSDYPNQEMATELLALRARVAQVERERDSALEAQKGIWIAVREAEGWKDKFRARVAQLEGALAALRDSESVPACFRTLADAALAQPAESRAKRMR